MKKYLVLCVGTDASGGSVLGLEFLNTLQFCRDDLQTARKLLQLARLDQDSNMLLQLFNCANQ